MGKHDRPRLRAHFVSETSFPRRRLSFPTRPTRQDDGSARNGLFAVNRDTPSSAIHYIYFSQTCFLYLCYRWSVSEGSKYVQNKEKMED